MVCQKPSCPSVLLVEYHDIFSLGPGVWLYWPGGAWDQSHWWWALQGEVPENSPTSGEWGPCLHEGNVASQSLWCNTVVLVYKKDRGLCFCIDFCKLNARTKKDSYPLPWIQEAIESLVGAGYFSCLDLKAEFWQINMDKASKQYTYFHHGEPRLFWVWMHAIWAV